ncbi:MAG: NlpC/P60 family protein [Thermaurantiacus sp.]
MTAPHPRTARVSAPRDAGRLGLLDPRTAAWRADLADIALAGLVGAPAYAAPVLRSNQGAAAVVHAAPADGSVAVSELLPGEDFAVLEDSGGWCWGWSVHDHYVGFVPAAALGAAAVPTHMVGPGDALLFRAPDIKAAVASVLPAGSRLVALPTDVPGFHAGGGGFVHHRHLLRLAGEQTLDWVAVAEGFRGAPYRWGGRTRAGIDCSGLVQVARMVAGRPTRRDSDMQAANARPVPRAQARRGDIACWPGHIGVLLDAETLLHATAFHMAVVVEPLATVEARMDGATAADLRRFPEPAAA